MPQSAADNAVLLRVEGWEVPQDLRVLAQVTPEDASFVVASVGDLQAVEDKIITPTVRSIVRNVTGSTTPVAGDQEGEPLQRHRAGGDIVLERAHHRDRGASWLAHQHPLPDRHT